MKCRFVFTAAAVLLSAGATSGSAETPFPGFDGSERLRLTQDYPVYEYMVLNDFPLHLLAPSWSEIQKQLDDSPRESRGCVMDRRRYADILKRQVSDEAAYKQKLVEFSRWLSANGVGSLAEAVGRGYALRTVLTPYCVERMQQGGLIHWDEARDFTESFSLELGLPIRPRSFQEQFPVIFHEWGHYVSHRMMEESLGRPLPAKEAASWLNPLDEGFADFVSYAFLGAPPRPEPPLRAALSSSFSDRELVFEGRYPYFRDEFHSAGEPFRDVLIRISVVYGTPVAMQVARDVFAEILTVRRKSISDPEEAANAGVSAVLKRHGVSLAALLQ